MSAAVVQHSVRFMSRRRMRESGEDIGVTIDWLADVKDDRGERIRGKGERIPRLAGKIP